MQRKMDDESHCTELLGLHHCLPSSRSSAFPPPLFGPPVGITLHSDFQYLVKIYMLMSQQRGTVGSEMSWYPWAGVKEAFRLCLVRGGGLTLLSMRLRKAVAAWLLTRVEQSGIWSDLLSVWCAHGSLGDHIKSRF